MLNLSDSEKKVLTAWAIVGIIILLIVLLFGLKKDQTQKEEIENITAKGSKYVIDRNRYYTVKNALTKFYSFINLKDHESVLKILDAKYVSDNKINQDNISEYIPKSDIQLSYETKRMCLKSLKSGVYTFVSEGEEISATTGKRIRESYYEVVLDGNTSLFSVKPIDSRTFEGVCNE